ncbi:AAA family ATPase [Aliivibrio fischeri]|uniref:AAA family ATPase n=1 Tax=Aliivibrio fischeri TaxID=668 RepID=UPI0012D871A5|nr:AAA family ATPase [Aliivibrio fischeri]MUK33827.1 AAA family ATPase [Aliivibrio fischeri]
MSKRINELPQLHNLTKQQQKVLRLPLDGQYLVVGAPGTGKSVVALHRMKKYEGKDKTPKVLTFNHVLAAHTSQLSECDLTTAMSWLYQTQYQLTEQFMPERAPSANEKKRKEVNPDYEQLKQIFSSYYGKILLQDLIIDEGQDLPSGYYESLMELGFENFFIVGDQNQQITEDNSSRRDLEEVLGLSSSDVIELDENFRNTGPIAKFCQHFYTDRASPLPKLPERPSLLKPTLLSYSTVNACVETILRTADRDSGKLIGVIVASETKREDYVKKFSQIDIKRDNERPMVSSYSSNQKQSNVNIDFSSGGIVVLCDKSVKGIEFDTVYVILDGLQIIGGDQDAMRKRLYVMTSRAKDELFLMQSALCPNKPVEALLPVDENILERDTI